MLLKEKVLLSPGEKIKKLRKMYRLTQDEIAMGMTRANLSIIESSNKPIAPYALNIIVRNFNRYFKANNINIELTEDYFNESDEKQINRITDEYAEELSLLKSCEDNKGFDSKVKELEGFLNNHTPAGQNIAEVYKIIMTKYRQDERFKDAYIYGSRCRDAWFSAHKENLAIRTIGTLCGILLQMGKSEEVLIVYEYALNIAVQFKLKHDICMKAVYYNAALAFKKQNQIEESFKCSDILTINYELTESEKHDIMILKGNCYLELRDYKAAEKYLDEIKHDVYAKGSSIHQTKLLTNYGELYCETGRYIEAEKAIEDALSIKRKVPDNVYRTNLHNALLTYIKLKKMFKVDEYLYKALDIEEKSKSYNDETKLLHTVMEYFIENKFTDKIDKLIQHLEQRVVSGEYKNNRISEVFTKAAEYFQARDKNKSNLILKKTINIIKIFNK